MTRMTLIIFINKIIIMNNRGCFELYIGCMFASKSTELIKQTNRFKSMCAKCLKINHEINDRHKLKDKDRMTQIKVRHNFDRYIDKLKELKKKHSFLFFDKRWFLDNGISSRVGQSLW